MSNINVKVLLKRGRNTEILMNDNLKLLGTFNTILGGFDEFFNGVDIEAPGASTKHRQLRPVTLKFGSHVRVNAGDEIVCEIKVANSGAFGTDIDASDSFIEYYFNSSQGYEAGIPEIVCEVVQANSTKQSFSLGAGVVDIAFLNFDKDGLKDQVINTAQLSSDRYDYGKSFNQLVALKIMNYGKNPAYRFGTSLPVTIANQAIFRALDYYPQSLFLLEGGELDNTKLDISFNGAQVAASQNYVISRRVKSSKEIVAAAVNRANKHTKENYEKLPATL
ncbi:MAG: hypothetical protein J0I84_00090 [Terrimonas sp.]|nr:hypothetical protein [Terrimonas sp.]